MKGLLALYLFALGVAVSALSLSFASLVHADWIILKPFSTDSHSPINLSTTTSYGLFETCTTTTYAAHTPEHKSGVKSRKECRKFPVRGVDCRIENGDKDEKKKKVGNEHRVEVESEGEDAFCDRWLLAGYAHQLSLIFSLTSLLSLTLTLIGTIRVGRGYRTEKLRSGWKLVVGLMTLQSITLAICWIVVRWEFGNEDRFKVPSFGKKKLGPAFIESVTSFSLLVFTILSILFVRFTQRLRIVPEGAGREDGYESIRD